MASVSQKTAARSDDTAPIAPLVAGDRLTRVEFERRYEAMPDLKKAELIEGVVYMPSPARYDQHASPQFTLMAWLTAYVTATPGVEGADNCTVRLDEDNEPQPDALLRIDEKCGGQSRMDADGYLVGPPELVVEVAPSSASYDLHDKKNVYRRNGCAEYLVWRVLDEKVDWFVLRGGQYEQIAPNESGLVCSTVFPGLWLDTSALIRCDLSAVIGRLQEGLASVAHVDFVNGLQDKA